MFSEKTLKLAKQVIEKLSEQNKTIITVESCTGGLLVGALTAISGASNVVYGGYITYANEAKNNMVGVPMDMIEQYGAVSKQVAIAMANGAQKKAKADYAIAITGIAGPTGGTKEKPVGLVHFALATNSITHHLEMEFDSDKSRQKIREASVITALSFVLNQHGYSS